MPRDQLKHALPVQPVCPFEIHPCQTCLLCLSVAQKQAGKLLTSLLETNSAHLLPFMQAVEAKEGVPLLGDSITQASITYQCFFKYFNKLAGMTVCHSLSKLAWPPSRKLKAPEPVVTFCVALLKPLSYELLHVRDCLQLF